MKKQLIQFNFPGMTERQYDQVWDELRKIGHTNPQGLIYHVSSFQNNNCIVCDVWESQEAFDRFGKILMPIMDKLGIRQVEPKISSVYYDYSNVETHATH